MAKRTVTYIHCPHCGATIKSSAKACPQCGSDEQTGWSDNTYLDGIDVGDDVDYDEMVAREFGGGRAATPWWRSWKALVAALIALLFVFGYLRWIG
jgi:hypothetical protein